MGMDLVPLNGGNAQFHANWSGWSWLGSMLVQLGCDTSCMSGSNDGEIVTGKDAEAWADAIEARFADLCDVEIGTEPVAPMRFCWVDDGSAGVGFSDATLRRLSDVPDLDAWVREFVVFLRASGGFEQW